MQTIGKHAGEAHRSDYVATCAYCGAAWYRSRLRRNAAGQLICPDDAHIRDPVTLSRLNAQRSSKLTKRKVDGGNADAEASTLAGPLRVVPELVVTGWDASSGITLVAGSRVSAWSSVSGSQSLSLINADPARYPLLKYDGPSGRPYVSFEGAHWLQESTDTFTRPSPADEPTFYWAIVRRPRWVNYGVWWGFEGGFIPGFTTTLAVQDFLEPPKTMIRNGFVYANGPGAIPMNHWTRIEAAFTASSADYLKAGNQVVTSGVTAEAHTPVGTFAIGNHEFGVFSWIDLRELWILKGVPSTEKLALLSDYARARDGSGVVL